MQLKINDFYTLKGNYFKNFQIKNLKVNFIFTSNDSILIDCKNNNTIKDFWLINISNNILIKLDILKNQFNFDKYEIYAILGHEIGHSILWAFNINFQNKFFDEIMADIYGIFYIAGKLEVPLEIVTNTAISALYKTRKFVPEDKTAVTDYRLDKMQKLDWNRIILDNLSKPNIEHRKEYIYNTFLK